MGDYRGAEGKENLRMTLNSHVWEDVNRAIFFKATADDGEYGFLALSLEDSKKVHAELGELIEEFEKLKPKVPTRREWVRALPYGTVFVSGSSASRYVRLDGDHIYSEFRGELITIANQFGDKLIDSDFPSLKVVT